MIYITGDTHRRFDRIERFCAKHGTSTDDVIIILGDAGINYNGESEDYYVKRRLSKLPATLFCVHGNHEMRPHCMEHFETGFDFHGGFVSMDPRFPNQVYALDGCTYHFGSRDCLVIGGAYSVDKEIKQTIGR